MHLRYLVVGVQGKLQRVRKSAISALWAGTRSASELGGSSSHELRLISVILDERLLPGKIYLLRVPLTRGVFTLENRLTLQLFAMPDCVTPLERNQHHAAGWPCDLARQLAVLLDVPLANLRGTFAIGGPLFEAAARSVSPRRALRYLR
jgi:hypothetical protein